MEDDARLIVATKSIMGVQGEEEYGPSAKA
jgi:hypothetical protein